MPTVEPSPIFALFWSLPLLTPAIARRLCSPQRSFLPGRPRRRSARSSGLSPSRWTCGTHITGQRASCSLGFPSASRRVGPPTRTRDGVPTGSEPSVTPPLLACTTAEAQRLHLVHRTTYERSCAELTKEFFLDYADWKLVQVKAARRQKGRSTSLDVTSAASRRNAVPLPATAVVPQLTAAYRIPIALARSRCSTSSRRGGAARCSTQREGGDGRWALRLSRTS